MDPISENNLQLNASKKKSTKIIHFNFKLNFLNVSFKHAIDHSIIY